MTVRVASDVASHKDRILEIFERHRASPGSPFPEEGFLNYLLAEPKGREAVRNSFPGLRRFNAFVEAVQLEFGVCFSLKDLEANYSLPRFVERVEDLERSPRGSLASLENQSRAGPGWSILVAGNFILAVLAIWLRASAVGLGVVLLVAIAANLAFLELHRRAKAYRAKLLTRIRERSGAIGV